MMKRHTDRLPARLSTSGARELHSNRAVCDSEQSFQVFSLWISVLFLARSFIRTNMSV